MINSINGDLLKTDYNILCHQVNPFGIMGAGIAYQIKSMYPAVFEQYKNLCRCNMDPGELLGVVQLVKVKNTQYIANIFSQNGLGRFKNLTNYTELELALSKIKGIAKERNLSVALPRKMGCDLAGGNWDLVYDIIERVFDDYPVTIVNFNKNI